ncbi:hypothetical protein TNCV_5058051 [Trichonephila clavipes]|nr:hypothetical protein TNCV_5058051 [Trichonephila clavipes]
MVDQNSKLENLKSPAYPGSSGPLVARPKRTMDKPTLTLPLTLLKLLVYETLLATVDDLTVRIIFASADIASTPELFECYRLSYIRRCRLRSDLRSRNFEQFL